MKVGILTTFADLDHSYSLVGVVLEQAGMMIANKVEFDLFVNEPRACNHESIDRHAWLEDHIRKEVPTARLEEDVVNDDLRERTAAWLREIAPDYDVLITHDWMFTTWNVSYNAAVRDVVEEFPGTTWVHWVHSAPSSRPARLLGPSALRYQTCPNSLYVYLNHADRQRYAESIGAQPDLVHVCHNPLDLAGYLGADEVTAGFIRKHRLWSADIVQVYPISMTRAEAKGLKDLIGIFGMWKRLGFVVRLVVVNSHANAPEQIRAIESYRQHAKYDVGLTEQDLIFTSDEPGWWIDGQNGEKIAYSVPNEAVKTLFRVSNIFVFPTISEACSRVLQEASLAGCLVVGNSSFGPMGEFLDMRTPQFTFGSLGYNVDYPQGKDQWLREVAKALTQYFEHPMFRQRGHMMRLTAWETIWRDQLLPLLTRASQMSRERAVAS